MAGTGQFRPRNFTVERKGDYLRVRHNVGGAEMNLGAGDALELACDLAECASPILLDLTSGPADANGVVWRSRTLTDAEETAYLRLIRLIGRLRKHLAKWSQYAIKPKGTF